MQESSWYRGPASSRRQSSSGPCSRTAEQRPAAQRGDLCPQNLHRLPGVREGGGARLGSLTLVCKLQDGNAVCRVGLADVLYRRCRATISLAWGEGPDQRRKILEKLLVRGRLLAGGAIQALLRNPEGERRGHDAGKRVHHEG